jgi:hypothetical protein
MQSEPGINDVLDVALLVGSALDAVGAKYMVVGSVASSLIGNPRTTNDIDIVTALGVSQVHAFCEALGADFDVDEKSLSDAMASGGSWNIFFVPWMLKIDIFAADNSEFQRSKFSRSIRFQLDKKSLAVLGREDLVLSKLVWLRDGNGVSDQQWRDIMGILRINRAGLDLAYLNDWSKRLGLETLLARARAESAGA